MGILRFELGNLVEVTPDGLLRTRIVCRVIPKIRLTTYRLSSREAFFGGCITIEQDHFTLRRQISKRIDEMSQVLSGHIGNLVVAAINSPFRIIGSDDRLLDLILGCLRRFDRCVF